MKGSEYYRGRASDSVEVGLTACSSADRSLQSSECKNQNDKRNKDQHEFQSNLDQTNPRLLPTNMIDLYIGSRDHPQPLVDGQDAVVPRVGPGSDGAEYVVERCIRRKVPLHAVLLLGCVSSSDEALDDAADLADWVFHLCVYGGGWCWKVEEARKEGCPRFSDFENMHQAVVEASQHRSCMRVKIASEAVSFKTARTIQKVHMRPAYSSNSIEQAPISPSSQCDPLLHDKRSPSSCGRCRARRGSVGKRISGMC